MDPTDDLTPGVTAPQVRGAHVPGSDVPAGGPPTVPSPAPASGDSLSSTATIPDIPSPPGVDPSPVEPPGPPAAKRGSRKVLLIVGIVIALIAGGIAAGVAVTNGSSGAKPPAVQPSHPVSSIPALEVLAAQDVQARAKPFEITLTWTQPLGGAPVDGYTVNRDGLFLADLDASTTTYVDGTVVPGTKYLYSVQTKGGGKVATATAVEVRTPFPPLSDARPDGDYNVSFKLVSESGFSSIDHTYTEAWHFKPKCANGACNVVWTDLSDTSFKATLKRSGASYAGSDSGKGGRCGGIVGIATVTVEFHVTRGRVIDGRWIAGKLVGTLTEHSAAQLGCVSSLATYTLVASVVA